MSAAQRVARVLVVHGSSVGSASTYVVHGWGFVLGTSHYWDLPTLRDHRMYVMGYRYFLHEPWHWPVFSVHTNMPFTRSIAFSDTPLLWALGNKLVATVIPPWRDFSAGAFLGLWYGVAAALQAVFGVANLRALGHRTWGTTIVTSLFFLAIPAWTYRFPHASLCTPALSPLVGALSLSGHDPRIGHRQRDDFAPSR